MKAISLWQPWASLIAHGIKTIETRSWRPPESLIGERVAIHAAKRKPSSMYGVFEVASNIARHVDPEKIDAHNLDDLPRGCVVAVATLDRAARVQSLGRTRDMNPMFMANCITEQVRVDHWGDFSVGRWLWFLRDVEMLPEPIEVRGRQRIFDVDLPASSHEVSA